jgi:hypothetical protein
MRADPQLLPEKLHYECRLLTIQIPAEMAV